MCGAMTDAEDLVREFLLESHENLDRLDGEVLRLETDPGDAEALASIFRTIHTIKGTCGFLGFSRLERIAHSGESLLARVRDGQLALHRPVVDALLAVVDVIRAQLAQIEATGKEGVDDDSALLDLLARAQQQDDPSPAAPGQPPAGADPGESRVVDSSVRVDVGVLDQLMNLVGELVLARNQLLEVTGDRADAPLAASAQRVNLITAELQERLMMTRMQPVGSAWGRFPRVVRELAQVCGKQVRIQMTGQDTGLDRTVIDAIKDPLSHLLRNAIDHGIEPPEARMAAGKPAEGRLSLHAYHEGGQVNIEVGDDGAGLDVARIRRRALERGLITEAEAARMPDHEAADLVFTPGFSTSDSLTHVSGRGVGMDVVRSNIERIGGTVGIDSTPGSGTTVRIRIPLTLAIVPAVVVTVRDGRFAIPQASVVELVSLNLGPGGPAIELVADAPVYRLRGELLPLLDLRAILHPHEVGRGPTPEVGGAPTGAGRAGGIVVVRTGDHRFGLLVDGVSDSQEIVVKAVGRLLEHLPVYAGATIMGDGRVALILDVGGVAQRGRVVTDARSAGVAAAAPTAHPPEAERRPLLLVGVGAARQAAIPLEAIARLENFPRSAVEWAGRHEAIRYRGEVLPLLRLRDLIDGGRETGEDRPSIHVVVHETDGRRFGLVVERVIDVVEEPLATEPAGGPGQLPAQAVRGSAIIQQRVTELVDVAALAELVTTGPDREPQLKPVGR
jgi:two-component system, chemotaxis family, sensor kinase CheA